jgi:ubiquinone biosynthesis protein COQ9
MRIEEISAMSDQKTSNHPATSDMTPEELRKPLLAAMLPHVAFDGWTAPALALAAADIGVSEAMAELAYPRGPIEVLEEHLSQENAALADALAEKDLPSMKIRDRITLAVRTRLELGIETREVARRSMAVMALPQNMAMAPKALWRIADTMWRAAGDTSTDHNYYTKRITLSAVYSAVLLFWLSDESEGFEDTWAFLDRRIENVMTIEKTKWQMRKASENMPSLSRFLGHLRRPGI